MSSLPRSRRLLRTTTATLVSAFVATLALAQSPVEPAAPKPPTERASEAGGEVRNSRLDAELFYQLLVSEAELRRGDAATAHQIMLDAARRTRDERLFQRAVEMAFAGRSTDSALRALKAWRMAHPKSLPATELQARLLVALDRYKEAQEPLRTLIEASPPDQRGMVILNTARFITPGKRASEAARALDEALSPWANQPTYQADVAAASARAWAMAGQNDKALAQVDAALQAQPAHPAAAAIAVDLLGATEAAQPTVQRYLTQAGARTEIRLGYARWLTAEKRYADALDSVAAVPANDRLAPKAMLLQGALQLELNQPKAASATLQNYLKLTPEEAQPEEAADGAPAAPHPTADSNQDRTQAYLMLAQAAEQQKDYAEAQRWLDELAKVQNTPTVTLRRAVLLAQQGRLQSALRLVDTLPETNDEEWRLKAGGRVNIYRETKQWAAARDILVQANQRFPNDADLMYEQALVDEKLKRYDEMETLLRRVIALKPDVPHAYNALGFSMAERNVRLTEAEKLVAKALELAPGDPFITDSAGWVEFRLGRLAEAERLLRKAYATKADPEIAVHLGEVLWVTQRRDEARQFWRQARNQDPNNEALEETLSRLKARL